MLPTASRQYKPSDAACHKDHESAASSDRREYRRTCHTNVMQDVRVMVLTRGSNVSEDIHHDSTMRRPHLLVLASPPCT